MAGQVNPVPAGYQTVTPHLVVKDAAAAIEFYKNAFGAREIDRMLTPSGKVVHAEMTLGTSRLMLADEMPQMCARGPQSLGGTSVSFYVYVDDVDAFIDRAVAAGAKLSGQIMDMFWGDRTGRIDDPFGHQWSIATHKRDVSKEESQRGAAAMFGKM